MHHILYLFISIFISTIDPFIWIHSFYHVLKPRYERKRYYILAAIGLFLLITSRSYYPNGLVALFFPIMFVYTMIVSKLLFQGKPLSQLKLFLIIYILSLIVDSLIWFLVFFTNKSLLACLNDNNLTTLILSFIAKSLNLFLYFILLSLYGTKKLNTKFEGIYVTIIYGFITIIIINICIFCAKRNAFDSNFIFLLQGVLMTISLLFAIYDIFLFLTKAKREYESKNQMELLNTKLSLYRCIEDITNEMRLTRHDLKSHLLIIKHLNEEGKTDEIDTYIKQIIASSKMDEMVYVTDNWIVSAVISETVRTTKQFDIMFHWNILCSVFPFSELETNSLFSNLLNNAIEATIKIDSIEKRKIELDVIKRSNSIEITCRNTYANKPVFNHNGDLKTSKNNISQHGMGLKIIKKIVRKYDGKIEYFIRENFFITKITVLEGESYD